MKIKKSIKRPTLEQLCNIDTISFFDGFMIDHDRKMVIKILIDYINQNMEYEDEAAQVKFWICELEWLELHYKSIERNHGSELSRERKVKMYQDFYDGVYKMYEEIREFFDWDKPKYKFPLRGQVIHKRLLDAIQDEVNKNKILKEIYTLYPYNAPRASKRDKEIRQMNKAWDMLKNQDRYLRASKWIHVKGVLNKVVIFERVREDIAFDLEDEAGNSYKVKKIKVTSLDGSIIFKEDIDFKIDKEFGMLHIINTLKCEAIKVIFSADDSKFKRIGG